MGSELVQASGKQLPILQLANHPAMTLRDSGSRDLLTGVGLSLVHRSETAKDVSAAYGSAEAFVNVTGRDELDSMTRGGNAMVLTPIAGARGHGEHWECLCSVWPGPLVGLCLASSLPDSADCRGITEQGGVAENGALIVLVGGISCLGSGVVKSVSHSLLSDILIYSSKLSTQFEVAAVS